MEIRTYSPKKHTVVWMGGKQTFKSFEQALEFLKEHDHLQE